MINFNEFQGIAADLGVEFGILLNRPSFFSIDSLINILVVAEGAGIDVNGGEFMTQLDTLVTGIWVVHIYSLQVCYNVK